MDPAIETAALLSLLVRAMVKERDAVSVTAVPMPNGTCFEVRTSTCDAQKVIGRNGRLARSLRMIVHSIGVENNGGYYDVNIIHQTAKAEDACLI